MTSSSLLATRFARGCQVLRSELPLGEDQMRASAPSIFAPGKHSSRSERYAYIPTIEVLRGLHREGFEPFMVAQGTSRVHGKAEFTKHMIRMRHAGGPRHGTSARPEAQEIILINSHDGASSYQMLAGVFRFVCCNGLVVGDVSNDIRIPHKGNVQLEVIEGAFRVLEDFASVTASTEAMKNLHLAPEEQHAYAAAALALRYEPTTISPQVSSAEVAAPILAGQLLRARRVEDEGSSLWLTFQRTQENLLKGGLPGRSLQGRRMHTRAVGSIDRSVGLNRALWVLAEEMRRLRGS